MGLAAFPSTYPSSVLRFTFDKKEQKEAENIICVLNGDCFTVTQNQPDFQYAVYSVQVWIAMQHQVPIRIARLFTGWVSISPLEPWRTDLHLIGLLLLCLAHTPPFPSSLTIISLSALEVAIHSIFFCFLLLRKRQRTFLKIGVDSIYMHVNM